MKQQEAEAGFTIQRSLAAAVILYFCTCSPGEEAREARSRLKGATLTLHSSLRHRRRVVHVLDPSTSRETCFRRYVEEAR